MSKTKNRKQLGQKLGIMAENFWVYLDPKLLKKTEYKLLNTQINTLAHINIISNHEHLKYADLAIIPQEQQLITEINTLVSLKVIPLLLTSNKLQKIYQEYDPVAETGCAFYYKNTDIWQIFAGVVRANESFKFPYDWSTILKRLAAA